MASFIRSDVSDDKKTLIEEGTHFKGAFSSSCPALVKGKIEGEITAPSLTVSSTGAVHGKVTAGKIQSEGELSGELDADTVQLSGIVKDKTVVRAKSFDIKLSSANGKTQLVFGESAGPDGQASKKLA
jgi:cytoskeletal protein CcmA (bactofilin family)